MGRKEAVRLEIFFVRGVRTLETVHIDLTLSLLIIQLISTREPQQERSRDARNRRGKGGRTHAVISCHIIVAAERLWQLWHSEITGQDFNTRRSGEEGGTDEARGPCGGFTEGVIKEIILITVGVGGGGWVCRLCNCTLYQSIKSWPGKWVRH